MEEQTQPISFKCVKCGASDHTEGEVHMAGGFWSKIFDVQGRKFKTASCKQCGYTEFYSKNVKGAEKFLDFLSS